MGADEVKFNLQTFLSEMREEQRESHQDLSRKIDGLVETSGKQETRIVVLENYQKTTKWLAGTVVIAVLGAIVDAVFVHIPQLFRHN
jgi:hypothetical protein